ncbi:hypothetical protein [Enterobacter hormaechei]|nr:hypothetical protein [Enterobacter hormaechei]
MRNGGIFWGSRLPPLDRPDRVAPETLTASDLTLPPLSWNRITFDIL